MKQHSTAVALVGAITVAGASTAVFLSGSTFASFSDTVASTPSTIGAATLLLGDEETGPGLGYTDLRPGVPQTVNLTVAYQGSVAADVGLSFTPEGGSVFCERKDGTWAARPGRAVTIAIGTDPEESYCSLLDGRVLPLGVTEPDAPDLVVPVTFTLAEGAAPGSAGLVDADVVTVHAEGGFTDRVDGRISMSTATMDKIPTAPVGTPSFVEAALAGPGRTAAVALDLTDPAATARTATKEVAIALPEACLDAGIAPDDISEIIALDAALPVWDALTRRGRGAGPFLVLGTAVADTITGSTKGDCIVGGGGSDTITGGDGDDVIVGGRESDHLSGEVGSDHLIGDAGRDHLRGGTGTDLLDGGADAATCDAAPGDNAMRCIPPVIASTPTASTSVTPAPVTPHAGPPAASTAPIKPTTSLAPPPPAATTTPVPAPENPPATPTAPEQTTLDTTVIAEPDEASPTVRSPVSDAPDPAEA